jgi:hypothetical protein
MTTKAKITRPGQEPRFISPVTNFKGYLVRTIQKGVGIPVIKGGMNEHGEGETWEEFSKFEDFYYPYFNTSVVEKHWKMDEFKKAITELDVRKIIGTEFEKALMKWGENEGPVLVEDYEDLKKKIQADLDNKILNKEIAVELGSNPFGLFLKQRVPIRVFDLIRKHGTYWSAEQIDDWHEDMDEFEKVGEGKYLKGWYFKNDIVDILKSNGFAINF